MRTIRPIGPYRDIVEARAPDDMALVINLGLREDSFKQFLHHYLQTTVAQYYGIVQDGLLDALHAFRGLKRPLMVGEDTQADQSVVVYSWRSEIDYVWTGSSSEGKPIFKNPPQGQVFVVLVREEPQPNEFGVWGSIERWNWIKEDPSLPHAPIDWHDRYTSHLWNRL